jgi:hypothetical protein
MANLKPFQVKVFFKDGSHKEYGFNTAMERKIYLWGIRDANGRKVKNTEEVDLKHACMGCTDQANLTYLREEGDTTCLVIDICEKCKTNIIMLSVIESTGVGRVVSKKVAFGLTPFEDLKKDAGIPED